MNGWIWTVGGIGFLLGMRHALDPDHVVAISTITTEEKSLLRSSLVGAFWGAGHALSLMCASGVVLAMRLTVSDSTARWLESIVAAILVALGINAIRRAVKEWTIHAHRHAHDGREHVHLHEHRKERHGNHRHKHILGFGLRPLSIGIFHGLAGSGALAVAAVATTSSVAAGLLYIAMLGIGSAAGMVLFTALMSLPLVLMTKRFTALRGAIQLVAGIGSIAFGIWWFWTSGAARLLGS